MLSKDPKCTCYTIHDEVVVCEYCTKKFLERARKSLASDMKCARCAPWGSMGIIAPDTMEERECPDCTVNPPKPNG